MKFKLAKDFVVNSEKEPWSIEGLRICLFGGSGSGKSWVAALLVEQWLTQGGTVVIFQPRDEYFTLKEKFEVLSVGGVHAKDVDFLPVVPSAYADAIVRDGVSVVFYTSDVDDEEKLIDFVRRLIFYILKYNEVVKRPILIVIEEAQEYAPSRTSGRAVAPWVYARMIKSFKDCFLQGRKLNVSTIALSPRPQEVNFTIRQLANLTFYGKFSPQDIAYIDRECLKVYRERGVSVKAGRLLDLGVGEWLVIRGAEASYIKVTEPRLTSHGAVTPKLKYEVPKKESTKKTVNTLVETIKKALEKESQEKSELEKMKREIGKLQESLLEKDKKIEQLETALKVATSLELDVKTTSVDRERIEKLTQEIEVLKTKRAALLKHLKDDIIQVFSKYDVGSETVPVPSDERADEQKRRIFDVWAGKLPSKAARRVLKFLLENYPAKYSKGTIAVILGYKSSSGTFNGAISFLKKNNLIDTDGKQFWAKIG